MKKSMTTWFWILTIPLLIPAMLFPQSDLTQPSSKFEIKEWPINLRTDLRGTSIKVVLPENALDRPWDDALIAKFQQLTGADGGRQEARRLPLALACVDARSP